VLFLIALLSGLLGENMKNKRNTVIISIIIILVLVIIGVAVFLTLKTLNIGASNEEYSKLSSSYASDIDDIQENTEITSPSINEAVQNPIDFASLVKQNDEIYSWIYIPDTNINYPVCQSKSDDNFYLDHDVYGNNSYAGAIYSQICNSKDYSDRVTVLYGHNMADGSMFANLHKFADADFFAEHDKMYIYTENKKLTYKIVSAFVYDDRHIMNSFDFSDDSVFGDYLDMILNPHSVSVNVRDDVELSIEDKIVTLSTCLNSGEGRYLVQGVLENEEQTQ
jgi:sortase B